MIDYEFDGVVGKSTIPSITARMLGVKQLKVEEFINAGISIKTITFNEHGTNKEKFRLGDVNFMEIYNTPLEFITVEETKILWN